MLSAIRQPEGTVLASKVRDAVGYFERAVGWIGHKRAEEGEGILFRGCGVIHTCLMRFPIDIVYLDRDGKVLAVRTALKPWRVAPLHLHTRHTLELAAHAADGLKLGDHIQFRENS